MRDEKSIEQELNAITSALNAQAEVDQTEQVLETVRELQQRRDALLHQRSMWCKAMAFARKSRSVGV